WLVGWRGEGEFRRMVLDRRDSPCFDPATAKKELAEFSKGLRHDRAFLRKMAESALVQWYSSFVFDPPRHGCNCKLALPACDCISRFKPDPRPGILQGPPKPRRPKVKKPIVRGFNATVPLYSAPVPRWWTAQKPRYENDPIIRSHDRSASVGM